MTRPWLPVCLFPMTQKMTILDISHPSGSSDPGSVSVGSEGARGDHNSSDKCTHLTVTEPRLYRPGDTAHCGRQTPSLAYVTQCDSAVRGLGRVPAQAGAERGHNGSSGRGCAPVKF